MRLRLVFARVFVFLLIGAVINIVIAWSICYVRPRTLMAIERSGNIPTSSGECLTFVVSSQPTMQRVEWLAGPEIPRDQAGGVRFVPPDWCWVPSQRGFQELDYPGHARNSQWIETVAGWPLRSLRWCLELREVRGVAQFQPRRLAIPLPDPLTGPTPHTLRALPLDPVWPAFGASSILFGLAVWIPVSACSQARRLWRRRRGLCPVCAYPIGVSPVCTECGAAVVPARTER